MTRTLSTRTIYVSVDSDNEFYVHTEEPTLEHEDGQTYWSSADGIELCTDGRDMLESLGFEIPEATAEPDCVGIIVGNTQLSGRLENACPSFYWNSFRG